MVKALRYWLDGPGIDSRWCHWGFFSVVPTKPCALRSTQPLKMRGAYGWQPTTLVVPNNEIIRGLNLPGTPWATTVCCGTPLLYFTLKTDCVTPRKLKSVQRGYVQYNIRHFRRARIFQNYRSHIRIIVPRVVVWSRWGTTNFRRHCTRNLVVMATWRPGFVHPWATCCIRVLLQIVNYRTEFTGVTEMY